MKFYNVVCYLSFRSLIIAFFITNVPKVFRKGIQGKKGNCIWAKNRGRSRGEAWVPLILGQTGALRAKTWTNQDLRLYSLVFFLNIDSGPEKLTGLSRNGSLLRNLAIAILERSRENITNRPQFSMVYADIDHRNDVIKCPKLKLVSLQSFERFMTSFLWCTSVKTMENCGRFVFYNNIYFQFPPKVSRKITRDMLRHFHGLYSHEP